MKMTDIFKIVRKIIDAGGTSDTHDPAMMANIYAGQCQTLNDRLRVCSDFIQKGLTSQALSSARQSPPLLPLCEEMADIEAAGWADLCREKGWQVPDLLLREAWEQIKGRMIIEKKLAPYLDPLRRANNLGNAAQCTALLRKIAKIDPDHPGWKTQLMEFETYRYRQIPGELARLKKENDLEGIARCIVELKQKWQIPVEPGLISETENYLETQLILDIQKETAKVLQKIGDAYIVEDAEALGRAVTQLQHLEKSRYFKKDETKVQEYERYERAMKWYRERVRAFNDQKARADILSQIDEKIAHHTDQGLGELFQELRRFDQPIPEGVENKIQAVMDDAGKAREALKTRKRRRNLLILSGIALSIVLFVVFLHYRSVKSDLIASMNDAVQAENLPRLKSIAGEMADGYGFLFNDREIQRSEKHVTALETLLNEKKRSFQSTMIRLEEMAVLEFPGLSLEAVDALFNDAKEKENAVGPDDKQRLQKVLNQWNEKKVIMKAEDEKVLAAILDGLEKEFKTVSKNGLEKGREADLETREKGEEGTDGSAANTGTNKRVAANEGGAAPFASIEALLKQTEPLHLSLVREDMRATLTSFVERLDRMKEARNKRKQGIQALQDAGSAGSLNRYLTTLEQFTKNFPDDPVSHAAAPVLTFSSVYQALIVDPARNDTIGNPFWEVLSTQISAMNHNVNLHMDELKDELRKMERTPRFTDLWVCTVKKPNQFPQKWYFQGEPTREFIDGILSYSGIAYPVSPDEIEPAFEANSVITVHAQGLRKMPHCDPVQRMLDRLLYEPGVQTVLTEMNAISRQDNKKVPPILKLHLINFLLKSLQTLAGRQNIPAFATMHHEFQDFIERSEVNWLCTAHRKYKMESRKAQEILKIHFKLKDTVGMFQARLKLREIAMRRLPRWVGFVDPEGGEGSRALRFNTGTTPAEVWVVRAGNGSASTPQIFVSQEKRFGQTVTFRAHGEYLPGEPLFAPYDANTTREVLDSIMGNIKGKERVERTFSSVNGETNDDWPLVWPVNVRSVE